MKRLDEKLASARDGGHEPLIIDGGNAQATLATGLASVGRLDDAVDAADRARCVVRTISG